MKLPVELLGAVGSPYSRKMLAYLRYRHIAYRVYWSPAEVPDSYPKPKVQLLPTFYLSREDGVKAVTDSTPLIRHFEKNIDGRSAFPENPVIKFLNDLIEDYADEWLTKAMFHYRWAHKADYENVGPLLIHWNSVVMDDHAAQKLSEHFTKRQIERLYVVGSNEVTAPLIETAYARFVSILNDLINIKGFVLGARPASADFALFGQLSQLALVEPTSGKITRDISARVRAWVERAEDLSGIEPGKEDWFSPDDAKQFLLPLLKEIGRTYVPVMIANAKAVMNGEDTFETLVDGQVWAQPIFKYQAKTLGWIRESYFDLPGDASAAIDEILRGTGCESLFEI